MFLTASAYVSNYSLSAMLGTASISTIVVIATCKSLTGSFDECRLGAIWPPTLVSPLLSGIPSTSTIVIHYYQSAGKLIGLVILPTKGGCTAEST